MSKIGIALAGGGPLGGIYEVGACVALEEAVDGLDATQADIYVGVSAGSFLAALLAHPQLLQRPILLANGKAVIGRPPEAILDIL